MVLIFDYEQPFKPVFHVHWCKKFVAKILVFSKLKQNVKFKVFMMAKNPHNFLYIS